MELDRYVTSLQVALAAAANLGTEEVQEAAQRVSQSLEPSLRLALMDLSSELAEEVSLQLEGAIVDVRLRAGSPEVVVQQEQPQEEPEAPTPPPPPSPADGEDLSRLSVRMPESLKKEVDQAASATGVSVNTWLVRAAQRAVAEQNRPRQERGPSRSRRGSNRISGWAR